MKQYRFTARYWDEDTANDFCGTFYANDYFDAHTYAEELHPYANSILITEI